jgi:hypothetical protein
MKLKIGDKVKMSKDGFHFYQNIARMMEVYKHPAQWKNSSIEQMVCEILALQGTGKVIKFNSEGEPFISWTYKNAGMFYKHRFHYATESVRKLTLWEKLCSLFSA